MKKVHYTKELLEENVKDCYSFAELCRRLGLKPEGSNPKTVRKKMDEFGIDYSHFTGKSWHKNPANPIYREKYLPNLCEHSSLSSTNAKILVYRLGLANSIRQARQMVVHGHILVNGKKVDRPSYGVSVGEVISLREKGAPSFIRIILWPFFHQAPRV